MSAGRVVSVRINGINHAIPEMWLVGRTQARQRDGFAFPEAYEQAITDWHEQYLLAGEYERGQA